VATRLRAPLDVFLVRKLGVPGHPELAMGAIAAGGVQVLSNDLIEDLGIPAALVSEVAARERLELERRDRTFRGGRPESDPRGRTVILIDDGLATGSTMEAAIVALRRLQPAQIIVAVPVGARETCDRLRKLADRLVCLMTPPAFSAVGQWYTDFSQTTDEDVKRLLATGYRPFDGPARPSAVEPKAKTSPRTHNTPSQDAVDVVRGRALRLSGDPGQYDALLEGIGDARLVLLGEATHGTHEFYRERAFITRRLIEERGFSAVAVEADWPDAYRVNR